MASPAASQRPAAPAAPCEGCTRRTAIADELNRANEDLRRRCDSLEEEAQRLRATVRRLEQEAQGRRSAESLVERLRAEHPPASRPVAVNDVGEGILSIAEIPIADD